MFKQFSQRFSKLPDSNKAMVYLTWLYFIGRTFTTIFVNIYVFQIDNNIAQNIIYNIIFFTSGGIIGFSLIGYLMSVFNKDIKNLYYSSYILFVLSFISIFLFDSQILGVYVFALIYGIGNGNFWCALHSQELKNIKDKNRDFYSSSVSAGRNILEISIPLIVALAFIIGDVFNFDGYKIVFGLLPLVFLSSFLFIHKIDSYYAGKVKFSDLLNFFNFKKYKYGHLYFLIGGLQLGISVVVLAVVSITLLKSEINIGLFQAVLGLISTFIVVHLGLKRSVDNRLKYFGIVAVLLCLNMLLLALNFSVVAFVIYSLVTLFLQPLFSVSTHVYDLKLMDNIKQGESDFFPAMLLREVVLWGGRICVLLALYWIVVTFNFELESLLQMGLVIIGILFLGLFGSIYLWEKREK